jgi:hypothetical protein
MPSAIDALGSILVVPSMVTAMPVAVATPTLPFLFLARISLERLRGVGSCRPGPFLCVQDMSPPEISPLIVVRLCLCAVGSLLAVGLEPVPCSPSWASSYEAATVELLRYPKEGTYLVSIGSWRLLYQNPSLPQSALTSGPDLTFRIRPVCTHS